jgi:hypothetical protein
MGDPTMTVTNLYCGAATTKIADRADLSIECAKRAV